MVMYKNRVDGMYQPSLFHQKSIESKKILMEKNNNNNKKKIMIR